MDAEEVPIGLGAPVLIVVDVLSGEILFEQNADLSLPPASLAKLMTLHLSMNDVESGKLGLLMPYQIPEGGRAVDMRPRSSVLGLVEGDSATILTLQRAAGIVSANDDAWSLALLSEEIPGSFVDRMNSEARRLGMLNTEYRDPDGWSARSRTTGKDQVSLALHYLESHPTALSAIHSLPEMIYLDTDDLSESLPGRNTNLLLGRDQSVDGLKTGTIPEAGYHFIATAERNGSRFLVLVMGLEAGSFVDGLIGRAVEAGALLDWAFSRFETWRVPQSEHIRVPVIHGRQREVSLIPGPSPEFLTIDRDSSAEILRRVTIDSMIEAPLEAGGVAGMVQWIQGDTVLLEVPMLAEEDIDRRWRLGDYLSGLLSAKPDSLDSHTD